MKLTAITGNPTIPLRQEREIARFEADARAKVQTAAEAALTDLGDYFANDRHLSAEQMADYRHRLAEYARSGSKPMQPGLDLPPSAA